MDDGRLGYSPESAAAALDVSRGAIFQAMRDGRLTARKMGRRTIIPAESLKAFLASLPAGDAKAEAGA